MRWVWKKIRSYGKQILVITFAQSLFTFGLVSLAFSVIFHFMGIPVFLGLIFGGVAMATAPAPALSIVSEYRTDGPVTRTLLPPFHRVSGGLAHFLGIEENENGRQCC